jgi:hypothetical protein
MPRTFRLISIFAYDLDQRGNPVLVWETLVDESEENAITHEKKLAARHAGASWSSEKVALRRPLGQRRSH